MADVALGGRRAVARTDAAGPVRRTRRSRNGLTHVVLCLGAVFMVGPFLWQLSTAFQTFGESVSVPPTFVPSQVQWVNLTTVFGALPFAQQLANSTIMTVVRTAGQVLFSSLAGFAFARMRFRGRNLLFGLFLSVMMVPSQVFLLPQYQLVQALGLLNTVAALFLPGMFSAFGTFLMRQFFLQLPIEIEEAARLDGANTGQIFLRVLMPMAAPGMLALGVLVVIWSWNDLLWPLVVNTDPLSMPVSAGLATLQGQYVTNFPVLMAGSLMASLPVIVVFVVFQRYLLRGIAFTGVKG